MSQAAPARALITEAAADLLRRLQERHGALMFHQSGGCCDGSSPMCYPDGEFLVGDRDILLAVLDVGLHVQQGCRCGSPGRSSKRGNTRSWSSMSSPAGAAASASKPPKGCASCRADAHSATTRMQLLIEQPAVTGAEFAQGARPQASGSHIVAEAIDACPIPGRTTYRDGAPAANRYGGFRSIVEE